MKQLFLERDFSATGEAGGDAGAVNIAEVVKGHIL